MREIIKPSSNAPTMAMQGKRGSDDRPRPAVSPPPSKRRVESTTTSNVLSETTPHAMVYFS